MEINFSKTILWTVICLLSRCFQIVFHKVLQVVVGSKKNALPQIDNQLLMDSGVVLAEKIRNKQVSSKDVVAAYIKRIGDVDPFLNAVVDHRFKDALEDAQAADEYILSSGKSVKELAKEKPFLGVPFTSKNAIGVKGLLMDSGVALKKGQTATEDSDVVALMRKAGAIPLCITNVPEFCMWFDASNTTYGRTNNPYDLTRISGGSSGGEGALIGAAASPIGMANDIYGSIRMPSYYCGIFGHKPSRRATSNRGQYPSSHGTDYDEYNITGPICKRAEDLLPVMKIMSNNNTLLKLDQKVNLKDIRVFYTEQYPSGRNVAPLDPQLKEGISKVVSYLENVTGKKATKIAPTELSSNIIEMKFMKYMKASSMIKEVSGRDSSFFNLPWEFLKWSIRLSKHTLNALVYMSYIKYYQSQRKEALQMANAKAERLDTDLKNTLGDNGVFIYPNLPEFPYYHQEQFLKLNNCAYTVPFNILGLPVSQCPIGLSKEGFPIGVQVVGYRYNDRLTMAVATEIEKGFGGWRSPS